MANWTPDGFAGQMFKAAGKYLPPPNMPPPVLWGVEDTVRERFGDAVSSLNMTKRMAEISYEFPPVEVVEFFRTYFGPVQMAFKALEDDQTKQDGYRNDLEGLWAEYNQHDDDTTHIEGEYLEVVAVKA
ncbi:MAG: hypothetical protein ABIU09_11290 [Pyrinomonadaceae bacterium]